MRITRMDLKGFGRFRQRVLVPGPGLNLVHGPNESGKSTLLAFVHAMLYGMRGGRRGRDGELPPLKRFAPWNGDIYQGVLEYQCADGRAWRVGRNFAKGTTHLQDAYHNDVSAQFPLDRETGPLFAQAHLGVDGDTFLRTLMVGQMHVALDAGARRGLMDSLLRLQESGRGEKSFREAENALQHALLERVGSDRSTVRPLDRIQARLAELEQEAGEVRAQRNASRELSLARVEAGVRVAGLQREQSALRRERALCRRHLAAEALRERRRRETDARGRLTSLLAQRAAFEREAASLASGLEARRGFAQLDEESVNRLPFDWGRLQELRRVAGRMETERQQKQVQLEAMETELPEAPAWRDSERLDAVLRTYLELREHMGSAQERTEVLAALSRQPGGSFSRWLPALLLLVAAAVLAGFAGLGRLGGASLPLALRAGMGLLSLMMAGGGLMLVRRLRVSKAEGPRTVERENGPVADPDGAMEAVKRWNQARHAFETILEQTGTASLQAFLRQKQGVDTVLHRMAALRQEQQGITDSLRQTVGEMEALQARTDRVFAATGMEAALDGQENQELLQSAWKAYRADSARLAELGMRLEAMDSERASLERLLDVPSSRVSPEMADADIWLEMDAGMDGRDADADGLAPDGRDAGVDGLVPDERDADADGLVPDGWEADADGLRTDGRPGLMDTAWCRARLPELQEMLDALEERLSVARTTLTTLETRLERVPLEDRLQQLLEETDRLQRRRDALLSYGESLRIATETLQEAARQVQRGMSPRLEERAGDILAGLSMGRYRRMGTDDKLSVRIDVPETSEMPQVSQLSGGTADQAWLAIRLAAVQLLEEGGEPLPLFLDEPFAQFDEVRTSAAMIWLRDTCADRQIFLFTCRERDRQLALEVFGEAQVQVETLEDMDASLAPMLLPRSQNIQPPDVV